MLGISLSLKKEKQELRGHKLGFEGWRKQPNKAAGWRIQCEGAPDTIMRIRFSLNFFVKQYFFEMALFEGDSKRTSGPATMPSAAEQCSCPWVGHSQGPELSMVYGMKVNSTYWYANKGRINQLWTYTLSTWCGQRKNIYGPSHRKGRTTTSHQFEQRLINL